MYNVIRKLFTCHLKYNPVIEEILIKMSYCGADVTENEIH